MLFRFSLIYSDLQELLGIAEMRGNVVTQSELLLVVQDLVVENPDLLRERAVLLDTPHPGANRYNLSEVVLISGVPPGHISRQGGPVLLVLPVSPGAAEGVGEVVGSSRLVVCHCHGPVSLIVARLGSEGTVDGDLVPVGAQSVAVSVVVGEQTTL